jgi:C4-dicarboxylate transporter DctM subunit
MKFLDHLEEWLIATLMALATTIIFIAVAHRYSAGLAIPVVQDWLLALNLSWAQELCIYMFIWMAKFGAAYGVRTGIHVGVDVLINALPEHSRKRYILFGLLAGALFTIIVGTLGANYVWKIGHTDQVSADLELPLWIVYLCIPCGSYLMCFRFLQVAWIFAKTGALPKHDPGHVEGIDTGTDGAAGVAGPVKVAGDNLHPQDGALAPQGGEALDSRPGSSPGQALRGTDKQVSTTIRWMTWLPPALVILPFAASLAGIQVPTALIIFFLLFGLMLTGMPISISLGLTVLTYLFAMTNVPITSVALKLFTGIEKFEIMAIPFFILAGNFLTHGGVARRMIEFASACVGHWHGGLALAGVMACALFAAVSGSSPATVVAIGSIILPAMVAQGFPKRFGAGVITTSGALGILIPPSIVMVMYSVATNTSVGQLFMAGVVPGLVLATMLGLTTWWRARKNNYPRLAKATMKRRLVTFKESIWGLMLIIVVIGGIYSGLFTPTEAAAMSAVYAFFVAVFVYKDMGLRQVPKVLLDSANMSAMLLYIITNAVLFSFLMTSEQIPQLMAEWMLDKGLGVIAFLLFVNVLLLLAGNVMEPSSIVLIMAPILFPVAMKLGVNPVHFGIMMTVNMEVGMCHPPVGLNLYVASGITKMGITELTVAVWPWLLTMLVFLVMVTYWPDLSLWLPRALGMLTS